MTYKWNLSEIRTKQRYLLERLKNCKDPKEKELIELSLVSNVSILSNSGSILNTRFYNFLDSLTNGKFSLVKHSKYIEMERKILFHNDSFLDNDYLQFLLNLANNVSNDIEEQVPLTKITIRDEEIVKLSKKFYEKLNNPIIEQLAMKILSDPTAINITNITRDGFEDFGGITYNDYVFDKSYINVQRSNTLFDFQVLNHEVMHGVDFYIHKKIPSKNYFGFHEVPTYTIDYLFLDFMEEIEFDSAEVDILKRKKMEYLSGLAQITLLQIKNQLIKNKGFKASINPNIENIKEILTPQILKQLLEIEAGLISYGLKLQIDKDKEKGLSNLVLFMNSEIPNNSRPNFSMFGLSDDTLLKLSQEYKTQLLNSIKSTNFKKNN